MPFANTMPCRIVEMTREGTSFRKFTVEEFSGKNPKPASVTGFHEMGARLAQCIGREVLLAVRFDCREYQGNHYWDAVVDGVYDAAGIEPPSIPAEERSGPTADQVPAMPDFRPPSVRNAPPSPQAPPPVAYRQEEETDDIPF